MLVPSVNIPVYAFSRWVRTPPTYTPKVDARSAAFSANCGSGVAAVGLLISALTAPNIPETAPKALLAAPKPTSPTRPDMAPSMPDPAARGGW